MAGVKSVAVPVACTLAVCALIAAALAALVPGVGGFRVALVNSVCIGMTAHLLIRGGWHLFWHGDEPPALGMTVLCVASVLIAIWVGGHAAAALLGESADWLSGDAGGVRIAALLATIGGTASVTGVIWLRQYLAALRLQAQLDDRFRRIHRSTIVNMDHVEAAGRDDTGRLRLCLRSRPERLLVSRVHADLFRPM